MGLQSGILARVTYPLSVAEAPESSAGPRNKMNKPVIQSAAAEGRRSALI